MNMLSTVSHDCAWRFTERLGAMPVRHSRFRLPWVALFVLIGLWSNPALAEDIWYIDGESSEHPYRGPSEITTVSVHFGVWPVAFGHSAGVVYTDDAWKTVRWDRARWVENVPNEYGGWDEIWRWYNGCVSVRHPWEPKPKIWFALYVDDTLGNRTWDNSDGWNYELIP